MSKAFRELLEQARMVHEKHDVLKQFCDFPTDLIKADLEPFHIPAAQLLYEEKDLSSDTLGNFRDAFVKAGCDAKWRETYKGTDIGNSFMDKFACYALIGNGGAWKSKTMSAFVVYMPAGLYYPWHQHPAEELYFVLAGEGEFLREDDEPEILKAGDSSFHHGNQPHALRTLDKPVMAYVLWRNHLDIKPVLTIREIK